MLLDLLVLQVLLAQLDQSVPLDQSVLQVLLAQSVLQVTQAQQGQLALQGHKVFKAM